jgi:hypothetical protein
MKTRIKRIKIHTPNEKIWYDLQYSINPGVWYSYHSAKTIEECVKARKGMRERIRNGKDISNQ